MTLTRRSQVRIGAAFVASAIVLATPLAANAADPAPTPIDPTPQLVGYDAIYKADSGNTLHGTIENAPTLERDDRLTVWINNHATKAQQKRALQDSEYQDATFSTYDQSITASTGMGSIIGPAYVKGMTSGKLPLTMAVVNDSTGTTGSRVSTGSAKATFSHPRPYLPASSSAPLQPGDDPACSAAPNPASTTSQGKAGVNSSSQRDVRVGQPWADAQGDLKIVRVSPYTDTSRKFTKNPAVKLDAGYGTPGICQGGSFPSGHTTSAYSSDIALATLLPELAPELITRGSEGGNNRIVLGVHYPLDIIGGRIDGEIANADRWSDATYRTTVLQPARQELVNYIEKVTKHSIAYDVAHQKPYTSNPYGGAKVPGGTAQIVTNRKSAVAVYKERLTYGFSKIGKTGLAAEVPAGAGDILRTVFPTLTDAQRTSVLAQTELPSGYPLDGTGTSAGAWQRLNLAAATSATVEKLANGKVKVTATGGKARVLSSHRS